MIQSHFRTTKHTKYTKIFFTSIYIFCVFFCGSWILSWLAQHTNPWNSRKTQNFVTTFLLFPIFRVFRVFRGSEAHFLQIHIHFSLRLSELGFNLLDFSLGSGNINFRLRLEGVHIARDIQVEFIIL